MTTTLQVAQIFDGYQIGDQIPLPDVAAQALLRAFPGRYQFASSSGATPGSPIVIPSRPAAVVPVVGIPDVALAATYGYALDLTSTPATLYHWSGTAWAVVLQASAGTGNPAPALAALTLSTLSGNAGTPFSATLAGITAGSTIAAISADGTVLTVSGGNVSGTFASAGTKQVTLTETLAGATGSPKATTVSVVVAAAPAIPVLQALTLSSTTATAGIAYSAAIAGLTTGSTLAVTASDGTALSVSGGTLSGTFAATGSPIVTLTETLAGATGSPKSTALAVTVSASAPDTTITTDLSNPDRGLNPLI